MYLLSRWALSFLIKTPKRSCKSNTKRQHQPLLWTQDKFLCACKWRAPKMMHQTIWVNSKSSQNKTRRNTILSRRLSQQLKKDQKSRNQFKKRNKKCWEYRRATCLRNRTTWQRKRSCNKEAAISSQTCKRNAKTHSCQMEWLQLLNREDLSENLRVYLIYYTKKCMLIQR